MNSGIKQFYDNRRICITGHTGFIGSWLTKWLLMLKSSVLGYALSPPTVPSMYETIGIDRHILDIRGDIRNSGAVGEALKHFKPEIVFHLAAQPLVLDSYENPVETFESNVIGTVNLLNLLRKCDSVKVIVVLTSDKSYQNKEWLYPYRENDPIGGRDPYSASKSCQDIVVGSFRETYFRKSQVAISSARVGNVIGGGDWSKYRLIPDIIRGVSENRTVFIRNPNSIRPWQHVLDPVLGIMKLAYKMWEGVEYSGSWNFGPNSSQVYSVKDVVDRVFDLWGSGRYVIKGPGDDIESGKLLLDSSKARELLEWTPAFNFEESLKMTVDWYKTFYDKPEDVIRTTESQIFSPPLE